MFFSPVFSSVFLPAFLPPVRFQSRYRLIFGIKKRLQYSIKKILYCNRAYSFYKTQTRLIAGSRKTIRVYNKVPWLCVTASRRFCRQVFNYNEGILHAACTACLSLYTHFTRRKPFCQVFLKKIRELYIVLQKDF